MCIIRCTGDGANDHPPPITDETILGKHADDDVRSALKEAVPSHLQRVSDIVVADSNTSANEDFVEGDGDDYAVEQRTASSARDLVRCYERISWLDRGVLCFAWEY